MAPHPDLLVFAIALEATGALGYASVPRVFDFFERPGKWADEFEVWLQVGRPLDYADPGWREFTESIESLKVRV